MRKVVSVILFIGCLAFVGGCSWVGQTAGKTQAKIERKVDSLEKGYEKGYEEEKAKTAPGGKTADENTSQSQ